MIRQIEKINENLFLLNDSMFPLYIIKGAKNYLVDCGISARSEIFQKKIKDVLDDEKIDAVLLTHSHYDHTGACSYLQSIYGFKILGSKRTVELLKKPDVINFIDRLNRDFNRMENIPEDKYRCLQLKNLVALDDNQIIKIDEIHSLKAIQTAGHTKCSMSYYLLPEKVLFLGDISGVIEKTGKLKPLFLSNFKDYKNTLIKIKDMDIELLALPHNRFIKGKKRVEKHLQKALEVAEDLKDRVINELKRGGDVELIAETILPLLYSNPVVTGPSEAFKINLQAMVNNIAREFYLP